jgi:hypothetical protein
MPPLISFFCINILHILEKYNGFLARLTHVFFGAMMKEKGGFSYGTV